MKNKKINKIKIANSKNKSKILRRKIDVYTYLHYTFINFKSALNLYTSRNQGVILFGSLGNKELFLIFFNPQ